MSDEPHSVTLPAMESEKTLPTQIHLQDEKILWMEAELASMQRMLAEARIDREAMIKRAKEIMALDDGIYKIIDVHIYGNATVDVPLLKALVPDKYDLILQNINARLEDDVAIKKAKASSFVSQADVKAVIRDKAILARVIHKPEEPIRIDVNVVKRE